MAHARQEVLHKHASPNTILHCIYGFYYLKLSKTQLAKIYCKHPSTISNWIEKYDENELCSRKEREQVYIKFSPSERSYLIDLYKSCPVLLLDEAKQRFQLKFGKQISITTINRILHAEGYSWKVLERRAVQLRTQDVCRYHAELSVLMWDIHNLVFLDEFAVDNRGILRTKGYAPIGERIVFRGEFTRRPRVSMLSFLGVNGLLESFSVEGTFTRVKFFECVRAFATSGRVMQHPGVYSIWILDGARIHCHHAIIEYLRSIGVIAIFLPAYAPFYNPIELVFGYLKRYLKRTYVENSSEDLLVVIAKALKQWKNRDCSKIFRKCGYFSGGLFDPSVGFNKACKV
ncbi:uncharacterized protein LOC119767516 [Culex quinquefasciatus]|uniref:uncharacterized protein LOC119767516 n=1 Tax=Culex quinquefasciatus TaxID=7176 RepID=UPI0018E3FA31|nr:uncharacterized protein LOC119767516 [Culex quinquefasciatus]XP_052563528.1 uncharacterized protein LOC128092816 [Culex pipiens pallens]